MYRVSKLNIYILAANITEYHIKIELTMIGIDYRDAEVDWLKQRRQII